MIASSCSHRLSPNPTSSEKMRGRNTSMPNSGAVLITRTMQPTKTRGCVQITETLLPRLSPRETSDEISRLKPVRSRTPSRAKAPPMAMSTSADHSVPSWPSAGVVRLDHSEPSVGRPPVNAK